MKKILLLLLLSFSISGTCQETKISIKNYQGVEITGTYYPRKEKENKTEYGITVTYVNTTDKEIFFKTSNKARNFASVFLKGMKSYMFELNGSKTKKKIGNESIIVLYPGEIYKTYIYFPWYSNPEIPEFVFEVNNAATLENDYSRYN